MRGVDPNILVYAIARKHRSTRRRSRFSSEARKGVIFGNEIALLTEIQ